MTQLAKTGAWVSGFIIFIMVIAAWSRISTMKEPAKIIGGGANAIAKLFEGVFK